MKVQCSRCGKWINHYQLLNGQTVCADDRVCYAKVHYVNHKAVLLNKLKGRWAL